MKNHMMSSRLMVRGKNVLHILGACLDYVAQPEGVTVEHSVWTSDGVAAFLTSLGCLVV